MDGKRGCRFCRLRVNHPALALGLGLAPLNWHPKSSGYNSIIVYASNVVKFVRSRSALRTYVRGQSHQSGTLNDLLPSCTSCRPSLPPLTAAAVAIVLLQLPPLLRLLLLLLVSLLLLLVVPLASYTFERAGESSTVSCSVHRNLCFLAKSYTRAYNYGIGPARPSTTLKKKSTRQRRNSPNCPRRQQAASSTRQD